jgi:N-acetylmuramoyl-L-alanine amidase
VHHSVPLERVAVKDRRPTIGAVDCRLVTNRGNNAADSKRFVPASVAYREAYARRRRHLRRQRQLAAAFVLVVALVVAGVAYALSRNANRLRVIQVAPRPPAITTVTVAAAPISASSIPRSAAASTLGSAIGGGAQVPRPPIVWKPIPFSTRRRAETAAYARRHYGTNSWRLVHPRVIVEHYTASPDFSSAFNTFSADTPDAELHELPGTCAHFIVDTDGTIYQLVPLSTICRHTVGLNWTAVGIEHVGSSDAQILSNPRQLRSSLELTLWLMQHLQINLANVIGHNESLTSPYHHELVASWRCQTHADWRRADMVIYRRRLQALARSYRVPIGSPAPPRPSGC